MERFTLISILFILSVFTIFSNSDQDQYYDTVNVRKDFFFDKNLDFTLLKEFSEIVNDNGRDVGIIFSKWDNGYDIAFYPATNGKNNYKTYGRIVYRFDTNKKLLLVKVFFLENNDSYLLFKNVQKKEFDVILLGKIFKSGINYYFDIEKLKYLPFYSIISILDEQKLNEEVLIKENDYDIKIKFINQIIIPSLSPYSNDGAINDFNEYVSINSLEPLKETEKGLNCSGFIKEIYDRYLMKINNTDNRCQIDILKKRNFSDENYSRIQNARYEFTEDPYFGKDWMENLNSVFNTNTPLISDKAIEIKDDLYSPYYKNRGFGIDDIAHILFRDQLKYPHFFYVIVFNKYASYSSLIPKFYHITTIVPYSRGKKFILRVFESGEETDFGKLVRNHLTQSFTQDTFENEILIKKLALLEEDEVALLKKNYIQSGNKRFYNLTTSASEDDVFKISRVFSKIDHNEEKVLIYKIPISYHFY